jgi:hypothetical protein
LALGGACCCVHRTTLSSNLTKVKQRTQNYFFWAEPGKKPGGKTEIFYPAQEEEIKNQKPPAIC